MLGVAKCGVEREDPMIECHTFETDDIRPNTGSCLNLPTMQENMSGTTDIPSRGPTVGGAYHRASFNR